MVDIVKFSVGEDELEGIRDNGQLLFPVRAVCRALGIDLASQAVKLHSSSWACVVKMHLQMPGDDQSRQILCVDRRTFVMWLATIDAVRVLESIRPKLERFQRDISDVIDRVFGGYFGGGEPSSGTFARALPANDAERLTILHQGIARIAAIALEAGIYSKESAERVVAHSVAVLGGTAPETGPRLLDVATYLQGKGHASGEIRSLSPPFGKALKKAYTAKHGEPPRMLHRLVNGSERSVCSYTESDLECFDQAYAKVSLRKAS